MLYDIAVRIEGVPWRLMGHVSAAVEGWIPPFNNNWDVEAECSDCAMIASAHFSNDDAVMPIEKVFSHVVDTVRAVTGSNTKVEFKYVCIDHIKYTTWPS